MLFSLLYKTDICFYIFCPQFIKTPILFMNSLNYKALVYTNFKLLSNLHVEESAYISSNVDIFGILNVNNDVNITGLLSASENVVMNSNLQVLQGISGDGSNITDLDANNINQGTLLVPYGGTGKNTFATHKLLSGNDSNALQEVTDLHWDSDNAYLGIGTATPSSTLDITGDFHVSLGAVIDGQLQCMNGITGDGSNLTNLDMNNASLGTLIVERGGTGKAAFTSDKVLLGNASNGIRDETDLHFDTAAKSLGIRTATPQYALDVDGDVRVTSNATFDADVTVGGSVILSDGTALDSRDDLRPSELLQSNLNIGVSTANPQYKLDVNGDMRVTSNAIFDADISVGGSVILSDGTALDSRDDLRPSELLQSNLNIGISTVDPQYKLDVSGDMRVTSNAIFDADISVGGSVILSDGTALDSRDDLRPSELLQSNLNIGVSTANPQFKLDVNGDMRVTAAATFESNMAVAGSVILSDGTALDSSNDLRPSELLQKNLNIGIGTVDPQYKLDVDGDMRVRGPAIVDGKTTLNSNLELFGDARLHGDLIVDGTKTTVNTEVKVTDQFTVINDGTGPALEVNQIGQMPIAQFKDDSNIVVTIADNGLLGLGTENPTEVLHVVGNTLVESNVHAMGDLTVDAASTLNGTLHVTGNAALSNGISVAGKTTLNSNLEVTDTAVFGADVTLSDQVVLNFSGGSRQMINMGTGDSNGIGVQTSATYFRTDGNYAWFKGGSHSDTTYDSGGGGTTQMVLTGDGHLGIGTSNPTERLDVNGGLRVVGDATVDAGLTVSAGISGDGSNITNLDVNNVALGILDVQYGGTGRSNLTSEKVLVGDGSAGINAEANLHYDTANAYFGIGTSNPTHTVDIDGNLRLTGGATLESNVSVAGDLGVSQSVEITGQLTVSSGITGDGSNITNLDVDNVSLGVLDVQYGGTGRSNLTSEKLLVGDGSAGINAEANLHYDVTQSRLGVNTSAPEYTLDVAGEMRVTSNATFDFNVDVTDTLTLSDGYVITTQNDLRPSEIHQANDMIGIRQTDPQYDLDVQGTFHVSSNSLLEGSLEVQSGISGDGQAISNLDVDNVSSGVLNVEFGGTGNSNLTVNHVLIGNGTSNVIDGADLYFDVENKQLAVGHSNPSFTLDVNGTIYASNNFFWSGSRLGIGTSNPQYELDVQGTIYASEDVQYASDRRIKSDIQPIDNVVQRMAGVRGHKFRRTDLGEDKKDAFHIGFIAQDLDKVVPECVGYSKEIDQYHVSYGNMVALLAEAYHNVHERLMELEKKHGVA